MTARWRLVPLAEVLRQRKLDVTVSPSQEYQFAGVRSFGGGLFSSVRKTGAAFSYRQLTRLHAGDIVYPKLMAWEGAIGAVPAELEGCVVSPEFPVFEVDSAAAMPAFLDYYLRSKAGRDLLSGASSGTNVRRRRVHPSGFLTLAIPLPPLEEQRRIVTKLTGVSSRLGAFRSERLATDNALVALLASAFKRTAAGAPRVEMALVAPLVRRPVAAKIDAAYPEVGIRSFGNGTFEKPDLPGAQVGMKKLFLIREGDLLFNIVFAWEGAVAVALSRDDGRVGSHRFLTCIADPEHALPAYLRFYFLTKEGLAALGQASPGGAGRNRTLSLDRLARMLVPVPSLEAQDWFTRLERSAEAARQAATSQRRSLDALLASLLGRAFRGEL